MANVMEIVPEPAASQIWKDSGTAKALPAGDSEFCVSRVYGNEFDAVCNLILVVEDRSLTSADESALGFMHFRRPCCDFFFCKRL